VKRVLFDTNILLDVILARAPHLAASAAALALVGQGKVEGYVAGPCPDHNRLVHRKKGAAEAKRARVEVAPITDASARVALSMGLSDLEDAVCAASAQEVGCAVIVTRNPQHFRKADPPAMVPEAFLASHAQTEA
jgi:predicted nucleic acid-binding protein